MSNFWSGFEKRDSKPSRKCVIILYWTGKEEAVKNSLDKLRIKHPSIKVKFVTNDAKIKAHNVTQLPTVILLKNGREKNRATGSEASSNTILSQLFRSAYS